MSSGLGLQMASTCFRASSQCSKLSVPNDAPYLGFVALSMPAAMMVALAAAIGVCYQGFGDEGGRKTRNSTAVTAVLRYQLSNATMTMSRSLPSYKQN